MKYTELVPGVHSSRIGFGCASIGGSASPSDAAKSLHAALDMGVTHFDVAPSYGFGEAEKFLGREIKSVRNDVVIATKFGIRAHPMAKLASPLKGIVRKLRKPHPNKNNRQATSDQVQSRSLTNALIQRVTIDPNGLKTSFEASLRKLRTDWIDFLFLHEPDLPLDNLEAILSAVGDLKSAGKLKGFGIATYSSKLKDPANLLRYIDVLQVEVPTFVVRSDGPYLDRRQMSNVLFSPMSAFTQDRARDVKSYLREVLDNYPNSIVLSSTVNLEHLKTNISSAE